jgi:hypothetical protein
MKIILINGTKQSGKDTASNHIDYEFSNISFDVLQCKFAAPMFSSIPVMFSIPLGEWMVMYADEKETPSHRLMGMSPRQAMIWLSEEVIKPKFGKAFYGDLAKNRINDSTTHDLVVFSDSGFVEEAKVIVDEFGSDNVYLVRLERTGHSFVGDSRSYILPEEIGIDPIDNFFIVENDTDETSFTNKITEVTTMILGD